MEKERVNETEPAIARHGRVGRWRTYSSLGKKLSGSLPSLAGRAPLCLPPQRCDRIERVGIVVVESGAVRSAWRPVLLEQPSGPSVLRVLKACWSRRGDSTRIT